MSNGLDRLKRLLDGEAIGESAGGVDCTVRVFSDNAGPRVSDPKYTAEVTGGTGKQYATGKLKKAEAESGHEALRLLALNWNRSGFME